MQITTKELRIQPGRIIDQVANGEEITVTFRGKALARIIPINNKLKKANIFFMLIFVENFPQLSVYYEVYTGGFNADNN